MNAMIWETVGGQWDVMIQNVANGAMTRVTCFTTEKAAVDAISMVGWNLLSIVRLG